MLKEKVLETIKKHNLINAGDRIVCGVSGGPDSISMLNILKEIKDEKVIEFDFVVAHINHGLRENAKIDEEYVEIIMDVCIPKGFNNEVLIDLMNNKNVKTLKIWQNIVDK